MDDEEEYSQVKSITVTVDNSGNNPPDVEIIYPGGGTVSGEVTIRGTASDIDGNSTIEYVQVKIGEEAWESADGLNEWSYTWDTTTLDDGDYTIYARAFDGTDYSSSESVGIHVDNPHAPHLSIISDIPEKISGTFTIQGTASDIDGEIVSIAIQIDDNEWEEIEATAYWSYDLDTTTLSNGYHDIKIRVTDDEGEFYIETLTIIVDNSSTSVDFPWWILLLVIVILIILMTVIAAFSRRKSPS
jgi:hypothetical protein